MIARTSCRMAILLAIGLLLPNLAAADLSSTLRRVMRVGAELSQEVPPKAVKSTPRRLDAAATANRKLDTDLARAAIRTMDADLLRQLDALPAAEQRLALQVFEGGRVLRAANPDELARARLVVEGGTDLLVAAQRHGDEVARPAFMLQMGEVAGQVPPGSVTRFSQVAAERGEPFLAGWNRYIVPNWKLLATGGAITTCLAASDSCIDAAGNLTAQAAETFARLGVEVAGSVLTGATKGAGEAIMEKAKGPDGLWFLAGSLSLILAVWALLHLRRWPGQLLRRIFAPKPPKPTPQTLTPRRSLHDRDI
jgi:hypothetical protein